MEPQKLETSWERLQKMEIQLGNQPEMNSGYGSDNPDVTGSEESQGVIPSTPEVISILELVDKAPPQSYEYL